MKLRDNAAKIGINNLAISTLRGQFADNQEWSADPSRPAIICGTVDMIGSRLLFGGYRIGFKSRPLHAGFLGQDALLVHDEAHLEPAFQKLIEDIKREQDERERTGKLPWPKLCVMALSATGRGGNGNAQAEKRELFELTEQEKQPPDVSPDPPTESIHHVWRRLKAKKLLRLHEAPADKLAEQIAKLALEHKNPDAAVLIYVRTIDDVLKVCSKLTDKKDGVSPDRVQQLTGTMRGYERDQLVKSNRVFARFMPPSDRAEGVTPAEGTVYLVCTSAGEVGVNLSADHMVCDLSTFESMVQRFGRANRFGDGDARIDVVYPAEFDKKDTLSFARENTVKLLEQLPPLPQSGDELGVPRYDASPKALGELRDRPDLPCKITDAFSSTPTMLDATDILFDAWAMTTIREAMPGRPEVAPYLHGVAEWEPPETRVAWREEVGVITGDLLDRYRREDLIEDYPLKPHELLRDRSDRVFKHLAAIAAPHPDKPVWRADDNGNVEVFRLEELADRSNKTRINYRTVLLPPEVGGLENGLLKGDSTSASDVADEWFVDEDKSAPRRVRVWSDDPDFDKKAAGLRVIRCLDLPAGEEDDDAEGRAWYWYELPRAADNEGSKSAQQPVSFDNHAEQVTKIAIRIGSALGLPEQLQEAIKLAARFHDLGKKREVWQRSIGNPNPTDWHAKSGRDPVSGTLWKPRDICPDYRHEFGSLLDLQAEPEFQKLDDELKDLMLHLIAAGHGRARPHFPSDEAFDPQRPQREAEATAADVPRRFARLQRKYGRWGLAYLESLLRAADYAASANPFTSSESPGDQPEEV